MNATPADMVTYLVDWETHLGGLPHLSCKRDQHKVRDPMASRLPHLRRLPHIPGITNLLANRPECLVCYF